MTWQRKLVLTEEIPGGGSWSQLERSFPRTEAGLPGGTQRGPPREGSGGGRHPWNVRFPPPTKSSHPATQAPPERGWLPRNSQEAGRVCVLQKWIPEARGVLWDLEMELPISLTTVCRGWSGQRRIWDVQLCHQTGRNSKVACIHPLMTTPDSCTTDRGRQIGKPREECFLEGSRQVRPSCSPGAVCIKDGYEGTPSTKCKRI